LGSDLEATAHPEEHEDIAWLLQRVRLFDTVDDESKNDSFDIADLPAAEEWTSEDNPSYCYYHYYMHTNLTRLNSLRRAATPAQLPINLRPHCGEAGPQHHLSTAFLFCQGISHGICLDHQRVLQYLYMLAQIPIGVSPISNSVLFLKYDRSPFPKFFKRGLCVTLTTDDPLMFHNTDSPLLEEYSTAQHALGLDKTDLAEVARNSCKGAFTEAERNHSGVHDNDDPKKTQVPRRRLAFRRDLRENEMRNLTRAAADYVP